MVLFAGTCSKLSQNYSTLYRLVAVTTYSDDRLRRRFNHPVTVCLIQLIIVTTALAIVRSASLIFYSEPEIRPYLESHPWQQFSDAHAASLSVLPRYSEKAAMICVNIYNSRNTALFATVLTIALALSEMATVLLATATFVSLWRKRCLFSSTTYAMHKKLTTLLVMQFAAPFLLLFLPVALMVYIGYIGYRQWIPFGYLLCLFSSNPVQKPLGDFLMVMLTLYGSTNTLLSLLFVGPYRRHMIGKVPLRRLWHSLLGAVYGTCGCESRVQRANPSVIVPGDSPSLQTAPANERNRVSALNSSMAVDSLLERK